MIDHDLTRGRQGWAGLGQALAWGGWEGLSIACVGAMARDRLTDLPKLGFAKSPGEPSDHGEAFLKMFCLALVRFDLLVKN